MGVSRRTGVGGSSGGVVEGSGGASGGGLAGGPACSGGTPAPLGGLFRVAHWGVGGEGR